MQESRRVKSMTIGNPFDQSISIAKISLSISIDIGPPMINQ